jgi:putative oxidoreductase
MMLYHELASPRVSLAILLLRIVIGLAFVLHGLPKIEHPMSWMTMSMGSQAFAPPWLQAIAAITEFFGGIALVTGFLTPLAAIAILCEMLVAIFVVHVPAGGHWIGGQRSFEPALFYFVAMLALLVTGPGQFSIDAVLSSWAPRRAHRYYVRS